MLLNVESTIGCAMTPLYHLSRRFPAVGHSFVFQHFLLLFSHTIQLPPPPLSLLLIMRLFICLSVCLMLSYFLSTVLGTRVGRGSRRRRHLGQGFPHRHHGRRLACAVPRHRQGRHVSLSRRARNLVAHSGAYHSADSRPHGPADNEGGKPF